MTHADVIAIKVELDGVEKLRNDIRGVKSDIGGIGDNAKALSGQYSAVGEAATRAGHAQESAIHGVSHAAQHLITHIQGIALAYLSIHEMQKLATESLQAYNKEHKFDTILKALAPAQADSIKKRTSETANKYGLPIDDMREMAQKMATSTIDPKKINDILEAFAVFSTGAEPEAIKAAVESLVMLANSGEMSTRELRGIFKRLPLLAKVMNESGNSFAQIKALNKDGNIDFKSLADDIVKASGRKDINKMAEENAMRPEAQYIKLLNDFDEKVLDPLGAELGPELIKIAQEALPEVEAAARLAGHAMVFVAKHWKLFGAAIVGYIASQGLLSIAARLAAISLNKLAASAALSGGGGGLPGIGGGGAAGAAKQGFWRTVGANYATGAAGKSVADGVGYQTAIKWGPNAAKMLGATEGGIGAGLLSAGGTTVATGVTATALTAIGVAAIAAETALLGVAAIEKAFGGTVEQSVFYKLVGGQDPSKFDGTSEIAKRNNDRIRNKRNQQDYYGISNDPNKQSEGQKGLIDYLNRSSETQRKYDREHGRAPMTDAQRAAVYDSSKQNKHRPANRHDVQHRVNRENADSVKNAR